MSCCSICCQWLTLLYFAQKQWHVIATDFQCSASWDPVLLCKMSHTFSWTSCYCSHCCTDNFPMNKYTVLTSVCMFITHKLPVSSDCYVGTLVGDTWTENSSWYCLSTATQKPQEEWKSFDNKHFLICHIRWHNVTELCVANGSKQILLCVEWCVKVSYSCVQ